MEGMRGQTRFLALNLKPLANQRLKKDQEPCNKCLTPHVPAEEKPHTFPRLAFCLAHWKRSLFISLLQLFKKRRREKKTKTKTKKKQKTKENIIIISGGGVEEHESSGNVAASVRH